MPSTRYSIDDMFNEVRQILGGLTSPALRIPQLGEVDWQIQATQPGEHRVTIRTPKGEASKTILVTAPGTRAPLRPLAPARGRMLSEAFLLFPAEPPLPASAGLRALEIHDWPARPLRILGIGTHWLIVFFVVSLLAGFAVKGIFGNNGSNGIIKGQVGAGYFL